MNHAADISEFLTVQQAASRAGLTDVAIRKAIQRGRLAETVVFGRKVVKISDLDAYLAEAKPGRPFKKQ